ncbi:dermonecrotic toxin StSicTox-betaIB1i-like [Uloborus diversus]|uniref:dermonecrotic toxin StSicTox-betaIB1i-like n=1 Tax=Uloborus diversus TaxID=327109 RepID=UPI00240A8B48|nr:dermonecrotic toxin StSicTox-betaIB1i-like [Uloborus diversus]XP_054722104.1 dermonecrotic toxin StSicTox-betaIB1i-like [Uloborus diversus]
MMPSLWIICHAALLVTKIVCSADTVIEIDEDLRRPIWNVAHMVNALYQADYYLDMGANALEFDIAFDWEGTAKYTFHGIPCDCFRSCIRYEHFITYIDYMRKLTTPGHPQYNRNLILLFMDLKLKGLSPAAKARAGEDIAKKLLDYYWIQGTSGARAYILISIPSISHIDFLRSFRRAMAKVENASFYDDKIGFDFSGIEELNSIRNVYEDLSITSHIWQGDGITNCLPRGIARLRDALFRRDQPGLTYIEKVYWWTVDKMSTMRTTLRLGVDGMITNYPDRLVSVLEEDEFAGKLRLATYEDVPWSKYSRRTEDLITGSHQARGGNLTHEDFMREDDDELLYNCE